LEHSQPETIVYVPSSGSNVCVQPWKEPILTIIQRLLQDILANTSAAAPGYKYFGLFNDGIQYHRMHNEADAYIVRDRPALFKKGCKSDVMKDLTPASIQRHYSYAPGKKVLEDGTFIMSYVSYLWTTYLHSALKLQTAQRQNLLRFNHFSKTLEVVVQ
jgi:hypothetical protein